MILIQVIFNFLFDFPPILNMTVIDYNQLRLIEMLFWGFLYWMFIK